MGSSVVLMIILSHEVPRGKDWQPAVLITNFYVQGSELTLP